VFAYHAQLNAHRLLAPQTKLAPAAEDSRIDEYRISSFELGTMPAPLLDNARAVDPHDKRQLVRNSGSAIAHVEVDLV
jgi:hypothetical protein